jgi:hypothetical protein
VSCWCQTGLCSFAREALCWAAGVVPSLTRCPNFCSLKDSQANCVGPTFSMHHDPTQCLENNKVDVTILSLSFLFLCTIRMFRGACLCWQGHLTPSILTATHMCTL